MVEVSLLMKKMKKKQQDRSMRRTLSLSKR